MLEARVERALGVLGGRGVEEWLQQAGIEVVMSDVPAQFGTATVRGYYEADRRRITVCTRAEFPLSMVLAHETFHAIDPDCPRRIAEAAADAFAERVCS
ncbi:MAG: hypothetical protein ACYCW6_25535 [Candidatus Xenobia bacterium]